MRRLTSSASSGASAGETGKRFVIFTECGEASQEVAKRGACWEQNFECELIDVMAACKRALLGDHKHIYGKSPDEQIKRW